MDDSFAPLARALAGHYRIVRALGQGGMATVYLAEDLKHERNVALKVLRPELAASLGYERFQREITTTANLRHPNILPLFDSGRAAAGEEGSEYVYYAMPWIEGETLRDRLEREKQLPLEDALRIAEQVADALTYAHGRGVIHRDIKPENILLEGGQALVADFGIARAIRSAASQSVTQTGISIGTPGYMSPEQALGSRELDGRSDLYALGCVTYEMLAGQPPFTGATAESVMHQHMAAEPRPVTQLRAGVPAGTAAALQRALAKSPADRFATPAAFVASLRSEGRPQAQWRGWWLWSAAALALVGALVGLRWVQSRSAEPVNPLTAIAVLPFRSLSPDSSDAYFAEGLHDELLTQLARVGSLQVLGRTSVEGYRNSAKPARQIGQELAVGSLVEGSLQVVGKRLRVTVRLLDPVTQAERWAERYDRTLDDAFAVQADIARRIVTGVGALTTSAESATIGAPPTANPEAYSFYLQGAEYERRPGLLRANFRAAQELYERALALDPGFALAHVAVSRVHGAMFDLGYDPSPGRSQAAKRAADAAVRLAPALPQAHVAQGRLHASRAAYRAALGEFQVALRGAPNDAESWKWVAIMQRNLGQWDSAFVAFDRARRLNPRDADLFQIMGDTYHFLHRYREAIATYRQVLVFAPDLVQPRLSLAWSYILWRGSLDTMRAVLRGLPHDADAGGGGGPVLFQRLNLARLARQPDSMLALIRSLPGLSGGSEAAVLDRAYWVEAVHRLRGDTVAARALLDSAALILDAQVRARPDDSNLHATRGTVLARLGRHADALREARWLAQWEAEHHAEQVTDPSPARAFILASASEVPVALAELERLLSSPSLVTVPYLRLEVSWDPVIRDPRYEAVFRKYADPGK